MADLDFPNAEAARWDPCVEMLLRGALLSRISPLRAFSRDADALHLLVTALRAARIHHLDWGQRGVWPCVATIDFPPPLVRGRPLDVKVRVGLRRSTTTTNMLSGSDFKNHYYVSGASFSIQLEMLGLWNGLAEWAANKGYYKPPPPTSSSLSIIPVTGDAPGSDIDRQALVAALGDLVEPFHVNMMPIVMGQHASLPDKCKRYSAIINRCLFHCPEEAGKVGYLTIHEGYVEPGSSQRRPGLHIESPGYFDDGSGDGADDALAGGRLKQKVHHWGMGVGPSVWHVKGGIFQASNLPDTCRVWDCVVRDHADIVGPLGSLEHFRHVLDAGPPPGPAHYPPPLFDDPDEPSFPSEDS
ncbi:hypothetical protein HK405_015221, partial [Cladochytrium tenue]